LNPALQKQNIISALVQLGNELGAIPEEIISKANLHNSWFTPQFIKLAATNWSEALKEEHIVQWLGAKDFRISEKKVGIIMAGNIPFVGLHDLICVIAKGHIAMVKPSGQDEVLIKHAISLLKRELPELEERIIVTERLNGINYLIATGSNNSARYFEYYFRDVPSLIRKNRTSAAVLTGNETDEELTLIADDIYTYFGLGCRNVTHLLLPRSLELKRLYEAYDKYMDHVHHNKYYNNYMYHKSILLMNLDKHYDNGFMLFQEKEEPHAPIATLNYHYYDSIEEARGYLDSHGDLWQCVVSVSPLVKNAIYPGKSQKPMLWDYSDNINTLEFLDK
jgi:hypothetical protein